MSLCHLIPFGFVVHEMKLKSNKWTMKIKQDEGINIDKGAEVNGGYSRDFGKASFKS